MVTHTSVRRTTGAILVIAGALLMWLAPGPTFTAVSGVGVFLLVTGIVLELVGIALERRQANRKNGRVPDL